MLLKIVVVYLVIMNLTGYFAMLRDKRRAARHRSRTPERRLFAYAALGGSVGVILGMYAFRHKTRRRKFTLGLPAILLAQLLAAAAVILLSKGVL